LSSQKIARASQNPMCARTPATVQPAGIERLSSESLMRSISRRSRARSASVSISCERSCFSITSPEPTGERTRRWRAGGTGERGVGLARVGGDPLGRLRVERDLLLLADPTQDLRKLLLRRRLDLDLVLNATQERFIHQRGGRAVRGEDEKHVERYLDLAAVRQ